MTAHVTATPTELKPVPKTTRYMFVLAHMVNGCVPLSYKDTLSSKDIY